MAALSDGCLLEPVSWVPRSLGREFRLAFPYKRKSSHIIRLGIISRYAGENRDSLRSVSPGSYMGEDSRTYVRSFSLT